MKNFIYLLTLILVIGCYKDKDLFIPDEVVPVVLVTASFNGVITDQSGQPVTNAIVQLGTETKETDNNGVFFMSNVEVNARKAFIRVNKEGYFPAFTILIPENNATQLVQITLLSKEEIGTFAATAGETISLPDGAVLTFPANAIANYDGTVHVAAKYLHPLRDNLSQVMPGDLTGQNSLEEEVALITYGMIVVEIFGDNNEVLEIASDQSVEIKFPISTLSNVPATIPLWYFDEVAGTWVEEGRANREGDFYVGTVNHFSYWNCDAPFPLIEISGRVIKDGEPIPNVPVYIRYEATGTVRYGLTNSAGTFSGKVPAGAELTYGLFKPECNDLLTTTSVTTADTDMVLADVIDDPNNSVISAYSGSVVDCDANAVAEGYILVNNNQVIRTNADGSFSGTLISCLDEIEFKGIDLINGKESTITAVVNSVSMNVGTLTACEELEEFFNINHDGNPLVFLEGINVTFREILTDTSTISMSANETGVSLAFYGWEAGTYDLLNFSLFDFFVNVEYSVSNPAITITLDQTALTGQTTTGTITGTFNDSQGNTHTVEGNFRLKRDN